MNKHTCSFKGCNNKLDSKEQARLVRNPSAYGMCPEHRGVVLFAPIKKPDKLVEDEELPHKEAA